MQDPQKLAALAAALVRAQRQARAVEKDAKNTFHGYKYASAEALIEEGRAALSSQGLSLLQTDVSVETRQAPPPPPGKGEARSLQTEPACVVSVTYLLLHEEGGMLTWDREVYAVQERGRPIDKAEAGALTTALGYAIRDLLVLPRDDEQAAMDRRDDRDFPPPPSPPPPPAPPSIPPPPVSGDYISPPAVAAAEAVAAQSVAAVPVNDNDQKLANLRSTLVDSHSPEVVAALVEEARRILPAAYAELFTTEARARWAELQGAAA